MWCTTSSIEICSLAAEPYKVIYHFKGAQVSMNVSLYCLSSYKIP